jgi:pimeloyl-ACP methyl ester carboxylesterase
MKLPVSTGISLYYEVYGKGQPLILIAGTGADHTIWARQVPELSRYFKVILVDHRGAGLSDVPQQMEDYTARIMAEDIVALMDALNIPKAHVGGQSLGSVIVQEMALNHPERVLTLGLYGTWGRSDTFFKDGFCAQMRYLMEKGDPHQAFKLGQTYMMSPHYLETRQPQIVADTVTAMLIKNPHVTTATGFLGHIHADVHHDALDRLSSITAPTLVTVGEWDANTPPRYGWEVFERIPNARMHVFCGPGAGHVANVEMAEEFNAVVLSFLRSHTQIEQSEAAVQR